MTDFLFSAFILLSGLAVPSYWVFTSFIQIQGNVEICAVRPRAERVGSGWVTKNFVLFRIRNRDGLYALTIDVAVDSLEHAIDLFRERYISLWHLRRASKRRDDLEPSLRLPPPVQEAPPVESPSLAPESP